VNAGVRFWRELSRSEGTVDSANIATGIWNCAPFDISSCGYTDTKHMA
jgi:hypothetical protein